MDNYEIGLVVTGKWYGGTPSSEVCEQLGRMPGVKEVACGDDVVQVDSVLRFTCQAAAVTPLRMVKGMELACAGNLNLLGKHRRQRKLYEVALKQDSVLIGRPVDIGAMRQVLGSCVIAIRGKADPAAPVQSSDVLLLEADKRYVKKPQWECEFSITKEVADSRVPRHDGVRDCMRSVVVCAGMLLLIALVTVEAVKLQVGAGVFLLVLVLCRAISVPDAYESMKPGVLFTIAGAFGLSAALQATGIANFCSNSIVAIAKPGGKQAIRLALYFVAMFLSMFMNNSATIAILGPMLSDIAKNTTPTQSVKSCLFVVVFAAGTCLTTPLGYQTNMMVMKDGKYAFGDFTKYGAPIQCLHMIVTLAFIWLFNDVLGL